MRPCRLAIHAGIWCGNPPTANPFPDNPHWSPVLLGNGYALHQGSVLSRPDGEPIQMGHGHDLLPPTLVGSHALFFFGR